VSGNENRLKDLESVVLGSVNLADLKEETNTLTFDVVLPEGVTNETGETQVTATITFPGLAKKKLTISKEQFLAAGKPADAEVTWTTEMVEVELRGPRDLINSITEKDISVTVDFTEEEQGIISKLPKLTLSSSYSSVGAISVSTVTASLQSGENDAAAG
jgi:YbbR domain-containing protein